ncbi:hypothetical protein ACFZDJ_51180 [Streptomyces sp. NPDC007896]|uniref:hypothetical protein n=1 Tax=unclassified Streptomyces TaxID=2593676 RepID=UPI0036E2307D
MLYACNDFDDLLAISERHTQYPQPDYGRIADVVPDAYSNPQVMAIVVRVNRLADKGVLDVVTLLPRWATW